ARARAPVAGRGTLARRAARDRRRRGRRPAVRRGRRAHRRRRALRRSSAARPEADVAAGPGRGGGLMTALTATATAPRRVFDRLGVSGLLALAGLAVLLVAITWPGLVAPGDPLGITPA